MLQNSYSSTFRGVTWSKRHGKWQAGISLQGSYLYLGVFYSEEEAARMWDLAALKFRGHKTRINFALPDYLDGTGNVVKHVKLDAALNNLRTKRAAGTAFALEKPGVEGAMAAAAALKTERRTINDCKMLDSCAAAAAELAAGAAKASADKSAKRTKRVTALDVDPVHVDSNSSNAAAVAPDSPCASLSGSSAMLPSPCFYSCSDAAAAAAVVEVDHNHTDDVWAQLQKSSTPLASSVSAAAGAAVSVTQAGSLVPSKTISTTPVALDSLYPGSMVDDGAVNAVGVQQQRGNTLLQQYKQQQQQQQVRHLSRCTSGVRAVAEHTHFTELVQPPQLPLQQQQCESHHCAPPCVGSTISTAAAATAPEVLVAYPDVQELLLPSITDLMQAELMPAQAFTQHAHYSSSCSLAAISELLLLAPGYHLVDVLSVGSAVCGAVLVAAYPRSGLVRVMPWRAYLWEPARWQQLGAYAAEGEARQACNAVLGMLSSY